MIIKSLPEFVFMDEKGGYKRYDLSKAGREIRWLSEKIRKNFAEEKRIGLLFTTSYELVLYWLAVLDAGKEPLVMQYPTAKQGKEYWLESVRHTIGSVGIGGIISGREFEGAGLKTLVRHCLAEKRIGRAENGCEKIEEGHILQLSSGTTGYRKGMRFSLKSLEQHVENYNEVLALSAEDKIVSWLPLYHDMGFIACFIMPLLLNVPVVMIDPMVWIRRRELLYQAIEEEKATVCFMPNFAFEIMAAIKTNRNVATLRSWISCSEPAYADTVRRFCDNLAIGSERIEICYAMAENVFAVSQSKGLVTMEREGREIVSCGRLLPGTEVKINEGEIFVKSDVSLRAYIDSQEFCDEQGFYPTGDMGFIENGELYVEGRKHDVMIQAGRKFMLTDLDYLVNEVVPGCNGRCACIAEKDERLGTQKLLVLLEHPEFYRAKLRDEVGAALQAALPLESFELHLLPEEFITKTSSGKINRKETLRNLHLMQDWQHGQKDLRQRERLIEVLAEYFPGVEQSLPVREVLDSLGFVLLESIANSYDLKISQEMTLLEIGLLQAVVPGEKTAGETEVIKIISLMSYDVSGKFTTEDLARFSEVLGKPVAFEHLSLPPSPVLLEDLIFCDYFLCRDYREDYADYYECIRKVKEASLILTDDDREHYIAEIGAFPIMSRKFQRNELADLLAFRHQKYARRHHLLPVGDVLLGKELPVERREIFLKLFKEYTDIPVFCAAFFSEVSQHTLEWDYKDIKKKAGVKKYEYDHGSLVDAVCQFIRSKIKDIKSKTEKISSEGPFYRDSAHFCSFLANPLTVKKFVETFDNFIIHGFPNSIPYLEKQLIEKGKKFEYRPVLRPTEKIEGWINDGKTCIFQTGPSTLPESELPIIAFISSVGVNTDIYNPPENLEFYHDWNCTLHEIEKVQILRGMGIKRYCSPDNENDASIMKSCKGFSSEISHWQVALAGLYYEIGDLEKERYIWKEYLKKATLNKGLALMRCYVLAMLADDKEDACEKKAAFVSEFGEKALEQLSKEYIDFWMAEASYYIEKKNYDNVQGALKKVLALDESSLKARLLECELLEKRDIDSAESFKKYLLILQGEYGNCDKENMLRLKDKIMNVLRRLDASARKGNEKRWLEIKDYFDEKIIDLLGETEEDMEVGADLLRFFKVKLKDENEWKNREDTRKKFYDFCVKLHWKRSELYCEDEKTEEELTELTELLSLKKDEKKALFRKATLMREKGRTSEAVQLYSDFLTVAKIDKDGRLVKVAQNYLAKNEKKP